MARFDGVEVEKFCAAAQRVLGTNCGCTTLRIGENLTLRLNDDDRVVRVARATSDVNDVRHELRLASDLAVHGYPVASPSSLADQPFDLLGHLATAWTWLPAGPTLSEADQYSALGTLLRRLHDLDLGVVTGELRGWEPLRRVRTRISSLRSIPDAPEGAAEVLEEAYTRLSQFDTSHVRQNSLVHGDAHVGNLYSSSRGVFLLDWESACLGPPEWDLVCVAMTVRRFGLPEPVYQRFVDAYGEDVRDHPAFEVLSEMRELTATSWLSQNIGDTRVRREFVRRLEAFRSTGDRTQWQVF